MNKQSKLLADSTNAYEAFEVPRDVIVDYMFGKQIPAKEEVRIKHLLKTNEIFIALFNGMKTIAEENSLTSVGLYRSFTQASNDKFVATHVRQKVKSRSAKPVNMTTKNSTDAEKKLRVSHMV